MVNVVERIVDKETKLRNYSQLVPHPRSQLETYRLFIAPHIINNVFSFFRRKHAKVCCANTQVWRYPATCNTHHHTSHAPCLFLEDLCQFLL